MIKGKNKINRKIFVEKTLGTRKYFSYRADLMLYKLILCILILLTIYTITSNFIFSIFISLQVFLIFTLINKLNLERKEKEGKKILISNIKKEYFNKKINDIEEITVFENLIKFFYVKQGYTNYKAIGKHTYSTEMKGETYYIKIFKLFNGAEVEKIDVRSFISLISQDNIKNGFLITNNTISDDANKFINKINENMKITIIDLDKLYDLTEEYKLLPENEFFYNKICTEKEKKKSINIIVNNALNNKKIIIYMLATVFFYLTSRITPNNTLSLYISYYFVILTIISILYFIYLKLSNKKHNKI